MANIDWDRLTQRACYHGIAPLLDDNNLVADMRSLVVRRAFEVPVVIDAIHSVQLRGGTGTASSDQREFVPHFSAGRRRHRLRCPVHGVHPNPDHAPSDGPSMLRLDDLPALLARITQVDRIVAGGRRVFPGRRNQ